MGAKKKNESDYKEHRYSQFSLRAKFDGKVFVPLEKVALKKNTEVDLSVSCAQGDLTAEAEAKIESGEIWNVVLKVQEVDDAAVTKTGKKRKKKR